ncbi:MAG: DNA-nicking Smr family endonuclease [Cellvibrionaceae bacterium]|jgi:DNA-nicking Smr family endonuclease
MSYENDFHKAMGDVRLIKRVPKVAVQKQAVSHSAFVARRNAAQANLSESTAPLVESEVLQLEANAILEFRRTGVQHGVFKQLRMGRYVIDARLDLHRMVIEQARMAVYQFVRDCMQNEIRCALITHGKGEGRKVPAVLKSHLAHWLPQISEVLAFHSAQSQHGGAGATYILLKKSAKKI